MPIGPYLAGRSFAPETIAIMNAALTEACLALRIADLASRKMVARRVIALVEEGQLDAGQLAATVIDEMREPKSAAG
jgi:hypothetical protein